MRPVYPLASRTAFSTASAPAFVKNTFSKCPPAPSRLALSTISRAASLRWSFAKAAPPCRAVGLVLDRLDHLRVLMPEVHVHEHRREVDPGRARLVPELRASAPAITVGSSAPCADQEWNTRERSLAYASPRSADGEPRVESQSRSYGKARIGSTFGTHGRDRRGLQATVSNASGYLALPKRRERTGRDRRAGRVGSGFGHQGDGRPLAEAGFVALAPDLYHGDLAGHTEMDRAAELMNSMPPGSCGPRHERCRRLPRRTRRNDR